MGFFYYKSPKQAMFFDNFLKSFLQNPTLIFIVEKEKDFPGVNTACRRSFYTKEI